MPNPKMPKVKTPSQMKMEMAVDRARGVLPKAERDANLGKMLEESAIKDRMYHGTNEDFDVFQENRRGIHFLTPDPEFAAKYAGGDYDVDSGLSPNIMPVYVNATNPFDFENKSHVNALAQRASLGKLAIDQIKSGDWRRLEDRTTLDAIKKLGFDGVFVKENGIKNIGVFDPTQIKSAIGNQGTYDINEPDITKAHGGAVHMKDGGDPDEIVDQAVMDQIRYELANQPTLKPTTDVNEQIANARRMADPARLSLDAGDAITSPEMYALNRDLFSVFNKPTYGSEIPQVDEQGKLIPTKVQQSYSQTPEGIQEMINKAYKATSRDHLGSVNPEGIKGVSDVLSTFGFGMAAIPVHGLRTGFHYLQNGNLKDAPSGKDYEELMQPKTQEGAEFFETIGEIPEKITGSTMGFGMHPNLWVTGMGTPSVAQMRAGLKLGAERAAPIVGKIDDVVRTGYESGAIPQPGLSIKDVTPRVLAPANEQGFYSATEAAALNLQRKSGSGQAFLNDLMKQENVRPDEISAMGLDTWLKGKKDVTAAEVQDYIAKNKIQLGESTYGELPKITPEQKTRLSELQRGSFERLSPDEFEQRNGTGSYQELLRLQNARDRFGVDQLRSDASRNMKEARRYQAFNNQNGPALAQKYIDKARLLNDRADLLEAEMTSAPPKYKGYSLPGGENYREVVITLPDKRLPAPQQIERPKIVDRGVDENGQGQFDVVVDGNAVERFNTWSEAQDHAYGLQQSENINRNLEWQNNQPATYKSSHWDEPNALAHLRMSDRVTDGKKTLLIDEVQSDWHQAGRERGYKTNATAELPDGSKVFAPGDPNSPGQTNQAYTVQLPRSVNGRSLFYGTTEEEALSNARSFIAQPSQNAVPDAPFKEDWYQLALKRAIKEAIDNGYDRVALPTGKRQIDRYTNELRANVDHIDYEPYINDAGEKRYELSGMKNGESIFSREDLTEAQLKELVGKDIASQIIAGGGESLAKESPLRPDWMRLSGDNLSIGGEGMKKYYDEVYPGFLKKFGKKYGASVGKTTVDADGVAEPLHYMEITPAMREAFKTGIHMKRGGKVSFANDIDAMRLELSKG